MTGSCSNLVNHFIVAFWNVTMKSVVDRPVASSLNVLESPILYKYVYQVHSPCTSIVWNNLRVYSFIYLFFFHPSSISYFRYIYFVFLFLLFLYIKIEFIMRHKIFAAILTRPKYFTYSYITLGFLKYHSWIFFTKNWIWDMRLNWNFLI